MRWTTLLIPLVMLLGSASTASLGGPSEDSSGRRATSDGALRSLRPKHDVLVTDRQDKVYGSLTGTRYPAGLVLAMGAKGDGDIPQDEDGIVHSIEDHRRRKNEEFKNSEDSPLLEEVKGQFQGLSYFPVDLTYRFEGQIHRHEKKETFEMIASDGKHRKAQRYGTFHFELEGQEYSLQIYKLLDLPKQYSKFLLVPFTDGTSGNQCYDGGRYIDLEERRDNHYLIDFNLAYNPSCVYGKKGYSCPIPPAENDLSVRIEAGEKTWEF